MKNLENKCGTLCEEEEFGRREETFIRSVIRRLFSAEAGVGELVPLKEGMTNDSFIFFSDGARYVFRCNGVGTEQLIDRENEAKVYELIRPLGIAEDVVTLSVDAGYKISHYYEHSRVCDGHALHNRGLTGAKPFDPFKLLLFYEDVRKERTTDVPEYADVKEEVFSLRAFLEPYLTKHLTLCHVDSVSDNFLFVEGRESPYLIDWEYAGLSDPLLDVAMFAIYDNFSEEETERLLQAYFPDGCSAQERARVYAYMAIGGLLWYNWCLYKESLGVTFGTYEQNQYRFAQTYPEKVRRLVGGI